MFFMADSSTFNVVLPVIALVNASDGPAAAARLAKALAAAGFEVYDGRDPLVMDSEVQVDRDDLADLPVLYRRR